MKKSTLKAISILVSTNFVSGCGISALSTRQTNPLLTDYQGILTPWTQAISTMSPDASRRTIIMRLSDSDTKYDDNTWKAGEFCAEPPPDAMVNTASSFAAALAAQINTQEGIEGSGRAEFIQQIAASMAPLLRRSQGLQWARDNLAFLCNAHLNRRMNKAEFIHYVDIVIGKSIDLIKAETDKLPEYEWKINGAPPGSPVLLTPPLSENN